MEADKQDMDHERELLIVCYTYSCTNTISYSLKIFGFNMFLICVMNWLMQRELDERKRMIKKYDEERRKNEKLEEIDELAREEAEYLLKKANELRQEQEEEVKRLNELILSVKVHAIRDAQVAEKQQIKRDIKDEEKRLDMMMEVDRLNAIRIQEEIEKKRKLDMKQYANTHTHTHMHILFIHSLI